MIIKSVPSLRRVILWHFMSTIYIHDEVVLFVIHVKVYILLLCLFQILMSVQTTVMIAYPQPLVQMKCQVLLVNVEKGIFYRQMNVNVKVSL